MMGRRTITVLGLTVVMAACSSAVENSGEPTDGEALPAVVSPADTSGDTVAGSPDGQGQPVSSDNTDLEPANSPSDTMPVDTPVTTPVDVSPTTPDASVPTTTVAPPTPTTEPGPATPEPAPTTTTSTTSTTTTTTVPALDVYDPQCVVEILPGDSLGLIADRFDDETVNIPTLKAENDLTSDVINAGDYLDVCVDNGLDDITGEERTRNQALVDAETQAIVKAQQTRLNELFAGRGIRDLLVDGISGPVTRQRLCAARLSLGLPVSTEDMVAGSEEEQILMAAESLLVPFTTAALSERWVLIDRTCQIMFVGAGTDELTFVFPTSTGEPGYETRDQNRSRVFRFDPALDNGGWHNSTTYPVAIDNPLSGNMYKPLYFDGGQAIHGANNVPTTPQSKGCARLRVDDQQALVNWLGLGDASGPTGDSGRINVTVNVQGTYVPR